MIEARNLSKRYGRQLALRHVSFQIEEGEIVGFVGPNGAGKTTTMKLLTGYSAPTTGQVFINGINMQEEPAKAKACMGYLPDVPPLYPDMKVDEYLNFVADMKGVPKGAARVDMLSHIKEMVHLTEVSGRLLKNLSKGYRQRAGLAQAMVGDPKVLILDEPGVGFDPKQMMELRDMLKAFGKDRTVFLSSHILSEISALCDRVIIINQGKIVAVDTPKKLSESLNRGHKLLVRIKGDQNAIAQALESCPTIKEATFDAVYETDTWDVFIWGNDQADVREAVFGCLAQHNLPIMLMKPVDLTLEEIFLQMTEKEQQAEATQETGEEAEIHENHD